MAAAANLFRPSFWYWRRRSDHNARHGIVVILGWMLSTPKTLAPYTRLYNSCGWDCLVCHPQFFNLLLPHRAAKLALSVLDELAKDLERDACPVVFSVFSGGHKACLYKVIEILLGKCKEIDVDEKHRLEVVKRSFTGIMFDSTPLDMVSQLGAKFFSHQVLTLKPGRPIGIISWIASKVGKGVDVVFSNQLEPQRIDLWHALYSSVRIGPILFFCSENDELAPVETIQMFAENLRKLGGKVELVVWKESEHVGHLRLFPREYSNKVSSFLSEASSLYQCRNKANYGHKSADSYSQFVSDGTWTDLPEPLAAEIKRFCKLPHLQPKLRAKNGTPRMHNLVFETRPSDMQANAENIAGFQLLSRL